MFYVLSGNLRIELKGVDRDEVVLGKGDVFVVPKGVQHRPVADSGVAEVMIVERIGVLNTGDAADAGHLTRTTTEARV